MDTLSKFAFPGILLVLTLAFGFWLSSAGKPYNGLLFNVHKLVALGGVIYMGWHGRIARGCLPGCLAMN